MAVTGSSLVCDIEEKYLLVCPGKSQSKFQAQIGREEIFWLFCLNIPESGLSYDHLSEEPLF